MINSQKCTRCGKTMKKIPIKRLDSTMIIEFYCDKCDESITYYTDLNEIKINHFSIF